MAHFVHTCATVYLDLLVKHNTIQIQRQEKELRLYIGYHFLNTVEVYNIHFFCLVSVELAEGNWTFKGVQIKFKLLC